MLNETSVPEGIETQVEFWFRTRVAHGLIMFLSSATQNDFIAVELRNAIPWFIFDCQVGVAQISPFGSPRFDDDNWHYVEITRYRRDAQITVDKMYLGRVQSPVGASYIDQNTGVYIGGVEPELNVKRKIIDSVYSLNHSIHYIGCLKKLRLQNKLVNLDDSLQRVNVEPLVNGCPVEHAYGFYLKGGGYLSLMKEIFEGNTIYTISFEFRTHYTSGILMFVYGESSGKESYFTVILDSGDIRVLYHTRCCHGNISFVPSTLLCDGNWHSVSITNFAKSIFTISIDGNSKTADHIADLYITSQLYFGGLPVGSRATQIAGSIGLNTGTAFGGCFRNIKTYRRVDLMRDVSSVLNVDLSGCPRDKTVTGGATCYNVTSQLVLIATDHNVVDGQLASFTGSLITCLRLKCIVTAIKIIYNCSYYHCNSRTFNV